MSTKDYLDSKWPDLHSQPTIEKPITEVNEIDEDIEKQSRTITFGQFPLDTKADEIKNFIDNIPERVKTTFNMGAFGGSSKKPSWLISDNAPWLKELKRDISPDDAAHFDSSENATAGISSTTGKKHVTGGACLKNTQA